MSTWNNVPGTCTISFYRDGKQDWPFKMRPWRVENTIRPPDYYDQKLGQLALYSILSKILEEDATLVINFKSSGYYQPMSMYGGPDRLGWPAESDDERLLEEAYLTLEEYDGKNYTDQKIELSREVQEELFEFFIEEVYNNQVEWPE